MHDLNIAAETEFKYGSRETEWGPIQTGENK